MKKQTRQQGRRRLTQKMIQALPPNPPDARSREKEIADLDAIGLRLSVSKTGRKFFDYRYTHHRRKRCIRLGEWPGLSLQKARHFSIISCCASPSKGNPCCRDTMAVWQSLINTGNKFFPFVHRTAVP
ncbi:MAG: DUF4102 domain-containing protein [Candidatus Hydrogenedens sp.]|nr:DUF4102 domain-containing protein [Candidatus Hydrogenedens sp.]